MSNYTPTTEEVRETWHDEMFPNASEAAFDRWLQAHDDQVRADTLEAAAFALEETGPNSVAAWLRARASGYQSG